VGELGDDASRFFGELFGAILGAFDAVVLVEDL
jgi:hypothetical protein